MLYALCGFANWQPGILIGGLSVLVPERKTIFEHRAQIRNLRHLGQLDHRRDCRLGLSCLALRSDAASRC